MNGIIGYYTNWGRLHGIGPISLSIQNLFTSPTLNSFLNILHPSDTHIMQTLQYFNSDAASYIHTTHTIIDFFVKHSDASIIPWIQDITSVLLSVILHNNLFHQSTLWIPRTHLTTSLKYFCLGIISHSLPTSWTFHM